jgi:hypothetical protein
MPQVEPHEVLGVQTVARTQIPMTHPPFDLSSPVKAVLQHAPAFVALGSAIVILYSVFFDLAYLGTFDLKLFSLLTLNDHIGSAIEMLPFVICYLIASILVALIIGRIHRLRRLCVIIWKRRFPRGRSSGPRPIKRKRWIPLHLIVYVLMAIGTFVFLPAHDHFLIVALVGAAPLMVFLLLLRKLKSLPIHLVLPIAFFAVGVAVTGFVAAASAKFEMVYPSYAVTLKSGESYEKVTLIKSVDAGVIIWIPTDYRDVVLNRSEVAKIGLMPPKHPVESRFCRWTNLLCG